MAHAFPTTRWSIVLRAAKPETGQLAALHELCEAYWQPLFAYLRHAGFSVSDAEDTVQGFFSTLLAGASIAEVDQDQGRFRSYLLGALRHCVSKQRTRDRALKRGGGQTIVSLDLAHAIELPEKRTPEDAYAHAWAIALLSRSRERLAAQYAQQGQAEGFVAMEPFLTSGKTPAYRELATTLGVTEGAARVAVHRLRTRFRGALREEVAQTVDASVDVDDELRAVIAALDSEHGV